MDTCTPTEFTLLIDMMNTANFSVNYERGLLVSREDPFGDYVKGLTQRGSAPAFSRPFTLPLNSMPLLLNDCLPGTQKCSLQSVVAQWRLKLGR